MPDVTAQAFREAATELYLVPIKDLERLLLAAAEQHEQLDHIRAVWSTDLEISKERILTLEIENQHVQQQIATLTAERDEWQDRAERQYDENVAHIAKYAALEAERDEARRLVQTLGDQAERLRRERDDARADLVARRETASRFLTHADPCVSASAYAVVGVCDGTLALLQPDRTEP